MIKEKGLTIDIMKKKFLETQKYLLYDMSFWKILYKKMKRQTTECYLFKKRLGMWKPTIRLPSLLINTIYIREGAWNSIWSEQHRTQTSSFDATATLLLLIIALGHKDIKLNQIGEPAIPITLLELISASTYYGTNETSYRFG